MKRQQWDDLTTEQAVSIMRRLVKTGGQCIKDDDDALYETCAAMLKLYSDMGKFAREAVGVLSDALNRGAPPPRREVVRLRDQLQIIVNDSMWIVDSREYMPEDDDDEERDDKED